MEGETISHWDLCGVAKFPAAPLGLPSRGISHHGTLPSREGFILKDHISSAEAPQHRLPVLPEVLIIIRPVSLHLGQVADEE